MIVKSHDRVGIDDTHTLDWREVAGARLARLIEIEQASGELHMQVERLRREHRQLVAALLERNSEISRIRPLADSWVGRAWFVAQWMKKPANWLAVGKKWARRVLKSMLGIRPLRRLLALALRLTPGLRARLWAMIGPA